jgi:6-phosphogluconolactonase
VSEPEVRVFGDLDLASEAAAEAISARAAGAIAARGVFSLALAGGSTPKRLYERLAHDFHDRIDWTNVHVFWGDERCVPPEDPRSNFLLARHTLLDNVPIPPGNIHRIRGELSPPAAASANSTELASFFGDVRPVRAKGESGSRISFDVALLGMGSDGHTPSLFPGSPGLTSKEWSIDVAAPPDVSPRQRITVTLAGLNASRHVLFLVAGADKREMLARVWAGENELPAGRVSGTESTEWIVDREALGEAR